MDGQIQVNLRPHFANLDLFVLGSRGAGGAASPTPTACDPANACLGYSQTAGPAAESVVFTGVRGEYYHIVVDAPALVESGYRIDVQCTKDQPAQRASIRKVTEASKPRAGAVFNDNRRRAAA